MLAYVFAHRPQAERDGDYIRRLAGFHAALAAAPPAGFVRSWSWRTDGGYEDWYLVDGWAALGALNDAAVTAPRQVPHDAVAALSGPGSGAVYALAAGDPSAAARVRWRLDKPRGRPYEPFVEALRDLAGPGAVWQRQMVLGADREFLVDAPTGPPAGALDGTRVETAGLEPVVGR